MAASTKCPSCGQKVPIPASFDGGTVTCPHANCGQVFKVQTPAPKMAALAPTGLKPTAPRPAGARPELLDRLPTNFLVSPAMFAVGLAVSLVYGMVLFGIVSARRNRKEPDVSLASVDTVPASPPSTSPISLESTSPPTADLTKAAAKDSTSKSSVMVSGKEKTKPGEVPAKKIDIARIVPPLKKAEQPTPVPAEEPRADRWGSLVGSPGDTPFHPEGNALTIALPPKLHILSPDLKVKNSPKLLSSVSGDFLAQVRVLGRILPGTQPLPNLPFTFQGAGLLIWEDEDNYLRVERTSIYSAAGGKKHQVLVEYCREGKLTPSTFRDSRDTETMLRIERKGSEVRCSYSPDDGKTWLEVKRQSVVFPGNVQVGVSASNASTKPYSAQLEDFQLSGPGVKSAKAP